jgi:hypothetical protein
VPADVSVPVACGSRQDVSVTAPTGAAGRRLGWSVAQHAVAHAKGLHIRAVEYDGLALAGRPALGEGLDRGVRTPHDRAGVTGSGRRVHPSPHGVSELVITRSLEAGQPGSRLAVPERHAVRLPEPDP